MTTKKNKPRLHRMTPAVFSIALASIGACVLYDHDEYDSEDQAVSASFPQPGDTFMVFMSDTQFPWLSEMGGFDRWRCAEEREWGDGLWSDPLCGVYNGTKFNKGRQDYANKEKLSLRFNTSIRDRIMELRAGEFGGASNLAGVVINGDLTAYGHGSEVYDYSKVYGHQGDWYPWSEATPHDGTDAASLGNFTTVYPGLGNHDYANNVGAIGFEDDKCINNWCAHAMASYIKAWVQNNPNPQIKASFDHTYADYVHTGSLSYSWNIGRIHLVQLHNYPEYTTTFKGKLTESGAEETWQITPSLTWLETDLKLARDRGDTIILNMHDASDHPISAAVKKLLKDYPVSAIFVGHWHEHQSRDKVEGIPVFTTGSADYGTFTVARFRGDKMYVSRMCVDHYYSGNGPGTPYGDYWNPDGGRLKIRKEADGLGVGIERHCQSGTVADGSGLPGYDAAYLPYRGPSGSDATPSLWDRDYAIEVPLRFPVNEPGPDVLKESVPLALRTYYGTFVTASNGGGGDVWQTAGFGGRDEEFQLVDLGPEDGHARVVAIRVRRRQSDGNVVTYYLSTWPDGFKISAMRTQITVQEKFGLVEGTGTNGISKGKIALKVLDGNNDGVDNGLKYLVAAWGQVWTYTRWEWESLLELPAGCEQFELIHQPRRTIALKDTVDDRYYTHLPGGNNGLGAVGKLNPGATWFGGGEKFELIDLSDLGPNQVAIRTIGGQYLTDGGSGALHASGFALTPDKVFKLVVIADGAQLWAVNDTCVAYNNIVNKLEMHWPTNATCQTFKMIPIPDSPTPFGAKASWMFDTYLGGWPSLEDTSNAMSRPLVSADGSTLGFAASDFYALRLADGQYAKPSCAVGPQVSCSSAVLDTKQSYSVSAWVKLDTADSAGSIVSQEGGTNSAFMLQRNGKFSFRVAQSALFPDPVVVSADSLQIPESVTWYHLVGVLDRENKKVQLYVNGKREGNEALPDCLMDVDHDTINNVSDNCDMVANQDQTDTDGDGLGNACDNLDYDWDDDTIENVNDNCDFVASMDQGDTDGDGLGNVCDPTPTTAAIDVDLDGITNDYDNCPFVGNSLQPDIDGNGLGDACDIDYDRDTITNAADNCQMAANPGQEDADGDGLGDVCDPEDGSDWCWNATVETVIGSSKWFGSRESTFTSPIDDVALFQRPLRSDEVRMLCRQHKWRLPLSVPCED